MERVARVQKGWVCLSDRSAEEIHRAWLLLRAAAHQFDHVARVEGWPTPFAPIRYLILAELTRATDYGFSARRLARSMSTAPSSLAHHLDVLEEAGFIVRVPWAVHDRRKVAVRLTDEGRYAVRRLGAISSPAMASP
jgi:DNA-binding MarR family transcriptional regulator